MRKSIFHPLALILAAAFFLPSAASAQKIADEEEIQVIDEVDEPAITIRKPELSDEILERKDGGIVKEIQVKSGKSTYYVYPLGEPNGVPGSFESERNHPVLWKVHEFDVHSREKNKKNREVGDKDPLTLPALPPPDTDKK